MPSGSKYSAFSKIRVRYRSETKSQEIEIELAQIFDLLLESFVLAGFDGYLKRIKPSWFRNTGLHLKK